MAELLYKELSYKIVGFAYEIFNVLGSGLREKNYSDALQEIFEKEKISFEREIFFPLKIRDKIIGKHFFDFVVEGKIVLEIKSGSARYNEACTQLFQYLKVSGLKLGLIIRFTSDGVKFKRIPNIQD